jgi:hypothetical protein
MGSTEDQLDAAPSVPLVRVMVVANVLAPFLTMPPEPS